MKQIASEDFNSGIKIRMKGNRLSHSQSLEESYMRKYGCFEAPPVGLIKLKK